MCIDCIIRYIGIILRSMFLMNKTFTTNVEGFLVENYDHADVASLKPLNSQFDI